MFRIPIPTPPWPSRNPAKEAVIGQLVIAWGVLEIMIDEAVGSILGVDETLQSSLTANICTQSKIEIFLSAVRTRADFFPATILDEINKVGHDTITTTSVCRDWITQGALARLSGEDEEKFDPGWRRRKVASEYGNAWVTRQAIEEHTAAIKLLIDRWHAILSNMEPVLAHIFSLGLELRQ